jgi:putative FmdB family regulatory protein
MVGKGRGRVFAGIAVYWLDNGQVAHNRPLPAAAVASTSPACLERHSSRDPLDFPASAPIVDGLPAPRECLAMPIYAYACRACGHQFDRLQKLSDPDPRECPQCGAVQVQRQVTAPSFRLAGSGWYETDFKKDSDKKRNLADKGGDERNTAAPAKSDAATTPAKTAAPATPAAAKPAASAAD